MVQNIHHQLNWAKMQQYPLPNLIKRRICQCSRSGRHHQSRSTLATSHFFSTASPRRQYAHRHPMDSTASARIEAEEDMKRRSRSLRGPENTSEEQARHVKRMKYYGFGIAGCAVGMAFTVLTYNVPAADQQHPDGSSIDTRTKNDAPPIITGVTPDTTVGDEIEQIPTGTSTIPTFPKTIYLDTLDAADNASIVDKGNQEYQLMGLGIRTVSFLGIQVYVVGLYIALADIAKLQEKLVRVMDPVATTLVPGERAKLKEILLNPEQGEEVWKSILKEGGIRTAIRIVPTRNTDFMHLRDGWVRGITGRTQRAGATGNKEFEDESFGAAVNDFKAMWGGGVRKNVPKGDTLLLTRDAQGKLAAWYEEKSGAGSVKLGGLSDERIGRLIWLGYLAGKTVSSEAARQSIIDGAMDYVERPVGTVATQVI